MDATYPRMVIKHAQSRLQACGEKIDIKGGCTSPGCAPAMRADIAAYLRGEDPVAARAAAAALSAKNATTPEDAAKAAEDVAKAAADAAAAAESGLTLPTTTEEGTTTTTEATAGPGVPLWVWLAGGAAAVLFLTRSSK
jgi:anti-sigma factor RsiW